MLAAQCVKSILGDVGPQRRDLRHLVPPWMGIVARQLLTALVARARLHGHQVVHLLPRQQRAAMPFVPRLSARRSARGSTLARPTRGLGARFRRGLRTAASPSLSASQFRLQRRNPCRLLLHDLLELTDALPQADQQHLHCQRRALPVAVGDRNLRGFFQGVRTGRDVHTKQLIPTYRQTLKKYRFFSRHPRPYETERLLCIAVDPRPVVRKGQRCAGWYPQGNRQEVQGCDCRSGPQ